VYADRRGRRSLPAGRRLSWHGSRRAGEGGTDLDMSSDHAEVWPNPSIQHAAGRCDYLGGWRCNATLAGPVIRITDDSCSSTATVVDWSSSTHSGTVTVGFLYCANRSQLRLHSWTVSLYIIMWRRVGRGILALVSGYAKISGTAKFSDHGGAEVHSHDTYLNLTQYTYCSCPSC